MTALVFKAEPAAGVPALAGIAGTATVVEGVSGPGVRQWILIEPGVAVSSTSELARQALVVLQASLLDEVCSPKYVVRPTSHVMPVPYSVAAEEADELDRWYADEHVELLLRCSDWLRVRRYRVESITGASWTRLVLHDLASADVLERCEVRAAMATPWRRRLASRPWFLAERRAVLAVVAGKPLA